MIGSQERPWVPSSVDAWYARLADEIAGLGPAATVNYVERTIGFCVERGA